jgi:hypothetical protein
MTARRQAVSAEICSNGAMSSAEAERPFIEEAARALGWRLLVFFGPDSPGLFAFIKVLNSLDRIDGAARILGFARTEETDLQTLVASIHATFVVRATGATAQPCAPVVSIQLIDGQVTDRFEGRLPAPLILLARASRDAARNGAAPGPTKDLAKLARYLRWQSSSEQRRTRLEPRFAKGKLPFQLRDDDIPVAAGGFLVEPVEDGLVVRSPLGKVTLSDISKARFEHVLSRIDGVRTVAQIAEGCGEPMAARSGILEPCLGVAFVLPHAVEQLEGRIGGPEISRVPRSPYSIDRDYWSNMADVRDELPAVVASADEPDAFSAGLRALHRIAVMGRDADRFYKPSSLISDSRVEPGFLRNGPVGVDISGMSLQHLLLYERSHGRELWNRPTLEGEPQAFWGRLQIDGHARFRAPDVTPEHLVQIAEPLIRWSQPAVNGQRVGTALVARFHWRFTRVHPFWCVNHSIAMNIVNFLLKQATGRILLHLDLDCFAMALPEEDYVPLFERAFRAHSAPSGTRDYEALARLQDRFESLASRASFSPESEASLQEVLKDAATLELLYII